MWCYVTEYSDCRNDKTHEWEEKEEEVLINTNAVSYVRNSELHEGRMLLYLSGGHIMMAKGSMKEFYDFIEDYDESVGTSYNRF